MSRRLLPPIITLAVLATFLLVPACGDKKPAPPSNPLEGLSAENAYRHTEAILAFGPRPPGSEALDKARDYVSAQLLTHKPPRLRPNSAGFFE